MKAIRFELSNLGSASAVTQQNVPNALATDPSLPNSSAGCPGAFCRINAAD